MVVARTAEPLAVPLARACSFPVEGPTCMTLSCLCGRVCCLFLCFLSSSSIGLVVCSFVCFFVCVFVCLFVRLLVCLFICFCVYMCGCQCVYVCVVRRLRVCVRPILCVLSVVCLSCPSCLCVVCECGCVSTVSSVLECVFYSIPWNSHAA
jgi:hypothetical protein